MTTADVLQPDFDQTIVGVASEIERERRRTAVADAEKGYGIGWLSTSVESRRRGLAAARLLIKRRRR